MSAPSRRLRLSSVGPTFATSGSLASWPGARESYESYGSAPVEDAADGRVLVLGHRGFPGGRRRENSVESVQAALRCGADGVEVDVRLSADGVLLCSHGSVVRTAQGEEYAVAATPAARLRSAVGSQEDAVATLQEVLAATVRHGRGCRVVVEAKPVADAAAAARTAEALLAAVGAVSGEVAVTVSSFDPALLRLLRTALAGTGVRTALLAPAVVPALSVLRRVVEEGHDEAHLHLAALRRTPHAVAMAHHLGVAVTGWTVNSRTELRRLAHLGVDAVITDAVLAARTVLGVPRPSGSVVVAGGAAC